MGGGGGEGGGGIGSSVWGTLHDGVYNASGHVFWMLSGLGTARLRARFAFKRQKGEKDVHPFRCAFSLLWVIMAPCMVGDELHGRHGRCNCIFVQVYDIIDQTPQLQLFWSAVKTFLLGGMC